MRVYQLSKGGAGIDALAMVERLEPWPAYRQVLVKIESCSLNVRDERVKALPAINGVVPINLLLDIDARRDTVEYDVDHSNDYHQHHHHTIHGEVLSVSFSGNIELDYDKFDRFVQSLPYSVYRAKGTVAIKGLNRRVIFHRVGARNILDQGAPWDGEQRN